MVVSCRRALVANAADATTASTENARTASTPKTSKADGLNLFPWIHEFACDQKAVSMSDF